MIEYKDIPEKLKESLDEIIKNYPSFFDVTNSSQALYNAIKNDTKVIIDFVSQNSTGINIVEEIKKLNK